MIEPTDTCGSVETQPVRGFAPLFSCQENGEGKATSVGASKSDKSKSDI